MGFKYCQFHGNYSGEACLSCGASERAKRDADRAQWRRYAEAALTGLIARYGDGTKNCEVAADLADAMLAADKAKWEGE